MAAGMIPFFQSLLTGVLAGGIYALVGAGLSLVLGGTRIVNLAHGQLVMLGMCGAWILLAHLGWNPVLSAVVVAPLLFLCGAGLQAGLLGRAVRILPQNQVLLTAGLGLVISSVVAVAFESGAPGLTPSASPARTGLLGLSASRSLLVSFGMAAGIATALALFLSKTETGQAIRATAQDREAARLMGIDVRRVSLLAAGLGAALAGVAGALAAPSSAIHPQAGGAFTFKALAIVLLGGTGSVAGAALGGVLVGVIESLAAVYVARGLQEAAILVLFLVLLLVKPSGLLGKVRD